jgi:hypothetical protein
MKKLISLLLIAVALVAFAPIVTVSPLTRGSVWGDQPQPCPTGPPCNPRPPPSCPGGPPCD